MRHWYESVFLPWLSDAGRVAVATMVAAPLLQTGKNNSAKDGDQ